MVSIDTRQLQLVPLTHAQVDQNFINLKDAVEALQSSAQDFSTLLSSGSGSTVIGDIQDGVGAVPRTVHDELRSYVRPEQFGADPASSNNLAAIQAAINEVYARGGGQVIFGPNKYQVSGAIVLYSKVEMVGEGSAATIIQQNDLASPLVKSYGFDGFTGTNNSGGIRRSALRGLTLQGTLSGSVPAGETTQHGVSIYGYGCCFEDVHARYFGGLGFYTEWANPGTAPDSGYYDGFVENHYLFLKSYMNGLSGIKCAGPNDGQWVCPIAYDNNLNDTGADKPNVHVTTKGNPQHFDQLHAWGNSSGVALLAEGSVHCSNCALEGAGAVQLKIKTGEVTYEGGMIFAAGASSSIGMQFVGGPGVCIGYTINTTIEGCNGGSVDFGTGIDAHKISLRAYQTSGTVQLGTVPTAGAGKSYSIDMSGGANNRGSTQRSYSSVATNFSVTGTGDVGFEYADHGGEGMIAMPQRKTEPAANYVPPSGLVGCARVNAAKYWQSSGNVGAVMGEPQTPVTPADNLDFSNYQTVTLAAAASPVTINNFANGLNGSPMFLGMPTGGAEITLTTTGNIRSKSGANITRSGLGSAITLCFIKRRDGNYYQV
jgi:hypothetical protein